MRGLAEARVCAQGEASAGPDDPMGNAAMGSAISIGINELSILATHERWHEV